MQVSDILRALPASLPWMVFFRLEPLRPLAEEQTIREMFFLPPATDLDGYSHVVLTPEGPCLAPRAGTALERSGGRLEPLPVRTASLGERFADRLSLFPLDQADCLGIGELPPFPPVALFLQVRSGVGEGQALFCQAPSAEQYGLLRAVGVDYLGGETRGPYFVARFRNRLPHHIEAGRLANFRRTGHCNLFFLQHGWIDTRLEAGLIRASEDRVAAARERCQQALEQLGQEACHRTLALTCLSPPPGRPFPYGDLVPLGFLLRALWRPEPSSSPAPPAAFSRGANGAEAQAQPGAGEAGGRSSRSSSGRTRSEVGELLEARRQGKLWSYHTGGLPTATDTALVLQGMCDPAAVEALEVFADGQGGYTPQRWSADGQPGTMRISEANRHWCQADYWTTCLVRALRREAGLPTRTASASLEAGFERRSGLYAAHPAMVDWALAWAIQGDETAAGLRERLRAEVLASMNDDDSFGAYDQPLATAFGILTLAALGCRTRLLRLAQLRLLAFMDAAGEWPEVIPFYSTLVQDRSRLTARALLDLLWNDPRKQLIRVNEQDHAVSFYADSHRMLMTAVAALALAEPCCPEERGTEGAERRSVARHPRYECRSHSEYIAQFALPPYLEGDLP